MGWITWLASYPKSGNTWVRAFLANYMAGEAEPLPLDRLTEYATGESGAHLYRRHDPRDPAAYTIEDVQRLRPLVHRDLAAAASGPVFVKTHNAVRLVRGLPLLTPAVTGGAIYVLRDPRDVAVSYGRHLGRPIDWVISYMADPGASLADTGKVFEQPSSWSIHVASWTERPNKRLHVMRYEDMAADPGAAFRAMLGFLGQDPKPERLALALDHSRFETLQAQEQAQGFAEKPVGAPTFFHTGRAGQWREALTPEQARRIEHDHGAEMRRWRYL